MAFAAKGNGFKTKKKYEPGYGLVIDLSQALPRKYDESSMGSGQDKGFVMTGKVASVLGALDLSSAPQIGVPVSITLRPNDIRQKIYEDLAQTNEETRFLFEGVTGELTELESRWAHGAGSNREINALEIVGVPHVSFENPVPDDGPDSGFLRLNLDGTPTTFDVRNDANEWLKHELPFSVVVGRLKTALARDSKFRVSQRVLSPSKSMSVYGQDELELALTDFRNDGYTSCVVRTFIPGTTDPRQVDVQLLYWPEDIEPSATAEGRVFEMPELRETKRFAALRDGAAMAEMEVIPGYELNLVGNPSDSTKSVKHKFVEDIVNKGLSDGQKGLYRSQSYGPGISIRAANEEGQVLGLTRLISRTEGIQYRNLMLIPTPHFKNADKIDFNTIAEVAESESVVS